jgi:peptidoglycan/LPS O-acetylase OafA/YrhL
VLRASRRHERGDSFVVVTTNRTDRLPGLDLLRAVAIVWVMLFHSSIAGGLGPNWSWASRFGWMGVDLFFVLSGFLIGGQVLGPLARGERLSYTDFYLRRAFRILPAYWVVVLLYWAWPGFHEANGIEPAWKFLTFIVNLSIDYAQHATFSHAWSLCVEEHFYWIFPVLAVAMLRQPSARRFGVLCALLVVGGIALRAAIWRHDMLVDPTMQRVWFIEDLYYPTWTRLDGLLCGVALAALKAFRPALWQRARRSANSSLAAGLATLALTFWLFENRAGLLANTLGWPVLSVAFGLLVFSAAERDSIIGRIDLRAAGWIATISYSVYLVHKSSYHVVKNAWGASLETQGVLAFAVYATTAILAGAALHYTIERPFLNLRRRLSTFRPGHDSTSMLAE